MPPCPFTLLSPPLLLRKTITMWVCLITWLMILSDGIYPKWATLIQTIAEPKNNIEINFAKKRSSGAGGDKGIVPEVGGIKKRSEAVRVYERKKKRAEKVSQLEYDARTPSKNPVKLKAVAASVCAKDNINEKGSVMKRKTNKELKALFGDTSPDPAVLKQSLMNSGVASRIGMRKNRS